MKKNQRYYPVWFPFAPGTTPDETIIIEKAHGCWLYAADGKQYLDSISSWWVNLFGHAHPFIVKAIKQQLTTLPHISMADFIHERALEVTHILLDLKPVFSKVFFSDDGSTSVEVALKMAVQYHRLKKRKKITLISFEHAYHGDTFGAMSAGGRSIFNQHFSDLLFDSLKIPVPHEQNIDAIFKYLHSQLNKNDGNIFIFEPLVLGAGGMKIYAPQHLDTLLSFLKEYNTLFIADEVMTGLYRTGHFFATDTLQHSVHLLCLSKGITGGFLPLGLTLVHEDVISPFLKPTPAHTFYHGHSYTGNALACAAAVASLTLLQHPNTEKAVQNIQQRWEKFTRILRQYKHAINARNCGTIIAFEVKTNKKTSYTNPVGQEIKKYFLSQGIYCRPLGNTVYFMPPYCINDKELSMIEKACLEWLEKFH